MIYIGIDPGKSGAIAFLDDYLNVSVYKFNVTETDIAKIFTEYCTSHKFALIEKVHSMPKQGVKSTFTFGQNYGFLRACLICNKISFDEVTPNTWQKALGCQTKGDKNITKSKAQQLFPHIKITHAIADALLIAYYNKTVYNRKVKGGINGT